MVIPIFFYTFVPQFKITNDMKTKNKEVKLDGLFNEIQSVIQQICNFFADNTDKCVPFTNYHDDIGFDFYCQEVDGIVWILDEDGYCVATLERATTEELIRISENINAGVIEDRIVVL